MKTLGSLLVVFLVVGGTLATERKPTVEERLIKDLLREYVAIARPGRNETDLVTVNMGMSLIRIAGYDADTTSVTINAWLNLGWTDFRLSWKPAKYDNKTALRLPAEKVWLPDIMLYNSNTPDMEMAKTKVVVSSDGHVLWVPPVRISFPCTVDHGGAKVRCMAKFGSWTFDGFKLDLKNNGMDISSLAPSPMFNVSETTSDRHVVYYACCPEPYIDLTYSFDLSPAKV